MIEDTLYYKIVQEYLDLSREKRDLIHRRNAIIERLDAIERIMFDLNDILCKYGKHIYEHFEESELLERKS